MKKKLIIGIGILVGLLVIVWLSFSSISSVWAYVRIATFDNAFTEKSFQRFWNSLSKGSGYNTGGASVSFGSGYGGSVSISTTRTSLGRVYFVEGGPGPHLVVFPSLKQFFISASDRYPIVRYEETGIGRPLVGVTLDAATGIYNAHGGVAAGCWGGWSGNTPFCDWLSKQKSDTATDIDQGRDMLRGFFNNIGYREIQFTKSNKDDVVDVRATFPESNAVIVQAKQITDCEPILQMNIAPGFLKQQLLEQCWQPFLVSDTSLMECVIFLAERIPADDKDSRFAPRCRWAGYAFDRTWRSATSDQVASFKTYLTEQGTKDIYSNPQDAQERAETIKCVPPYPASRPLTQSFEGRTVTLYEPCYSASNLQGALTLPTASTYADCRVVLGDNPNDFSVGKRHQECLDRVLGQTNDLVGCITYLDSLKSLWPRAFQDSSADTRFFTPMGSCQSQGYRFSSSWAGVTADQLEQFFTYLKTQQQQESYLTFDLASARGRELQCPYLNRTIGGAHNFETTFESYPVLLFRPCSSEELLQQYLKR